MSDRATLRECLCRPEIFQALGDPTRAALLAELAACCGDEQTVSQLAARHPVHLSVVSRHLKTLRQAGLIECQRRGREVACSVRYDELAATLREMAEAIESCCPGPAQRSTETQKRVERRL